MKVQILKGDFFSRFTHLLSFEEFTLKVALFQIIKFEALGEERRSQKIAVRENEG